MARRANQGSKEAVLEIPGWPLGKKVSILIMDHLSVIPDPRTRKVNPSYAVGEIFVDFLAYFGRRIMVFPGILKTVDSKRVGNPD